MEHSIIYLTDTEKIIGNTKIKARIGLAKEGLWQSIVSDIFTFCMILFSFCINAYFIHSRLLSCLLLFMFLVMVNRRQKTLTKEEFLELVKNELENEE